MPPRGRRRDPARRRTGLALALALVAALLFLGGLALGRALEEQPGPGGEITRVRTLEPLELPPERETVTVTVTATTAPP